ncbi:MAG: hypothetical protein M3498_15065 [Deinococcota bacterium]|jgi:hypothetical protein|nr:hypothetical protein [Deinococcota bacterium]
MITDTTHESNWIRDSDGNLVNLERVGEIHKVKLEEGSCEVVVNFADSDEIGVLYRGPEARADALLFGVAVILGAWDVETIIETTLEEEEDDGRSG